MSMTRGTNGTKSSEDAVPRPPSSQGSTSSSGSSRHVKCIGRYVVTGSLGKGNFARVEAAVHTLTRAKVAIKIIETDKIKEDYVRKNLLREAQLMRRLRHPNIIRLYETMKTNNLYCLVTEIAEGGELLSHVRNDFKEKRLSEATARPFIRQLVSALYHLHSGGIVHRDLKMENILLDRRKRQVKIVDFGLSNAAKPGSLLQTHCGSPEYAAPELFIPGRQYGPEVDVWSLGVNMYAMLVGKLPFRSPRQGTKRRQKLLEQISNGLTEAHEMEMEHITQGARNLIFRLLQPDPQLRTGLDEVMLHTWITKDGTQPLHPFKYIPPDATTQMNVVDLMSAVLEVNPSDIKETVRRDRCDWLAAIYNLLIEQPEGRNIIQRLIMDDPEDQLVDAAHYQGSMEHFRLSQGENLDSYPPDVASMLYNATAQLRRSSGRRYSLSQPQAQSEAGDYTSSTLPLTRRERHRHSSQDPHPLGAPRNLGPVHPLHAPGYMLRRSSIASPVSSPEHQHQPYAGHLQQPQPHSHAGHMQQPQPHPHAGHMQQPQPHPHAGHMQQPPMENYQQQLHHHHHHHHSNRHHQHGSSGSSSSSRHRGKRVLPMTPNEEPYQHPPPESMRPHSRAESTPDPLPMPWRPKLAAHNQLVPPPQVTRTAPTSPTSPPVVETGSPTMTENTSKVHQEFREPLISPVTQQHPHKSTLKKKLAPLRPKSMSVGSGGMVNLSKSTDGLNLKASLIEQPGSHTVSGIAWQQHRKVVPLKTKRNSEGVLQGWSSIQRLGQPADIQSFMRIGQGMPSSSFNVIPFDTHKLDLSSHNNRETGSATSVEISHEMFTPSAKSQPTSPIGSKGSSPQGPSPQASNAHFRSENCKVDPLSDRELSMSQKHNRHLQHPQNHIHHRSVSAKPSKRHEPHYMVEYPPEHSNSMKYVGIDSQRQGQNPGYLYQQDLPSLDDSKEKLSSGRHGNGGGLGFMGKKAFKSKSSLKEKSVSMTLHPKV